MTKFGRDEQRTVTISYLAELYAKERLLTKLLGALERSPVSGLDGLPCVCDRIAGDAHDITCGELRDTVMKARRL